MSPTNGGWLAEGLVPSLTGGARCDRGPYGRQRVLPGASPPAGPSGSSSLRSALRNACHRVPPAGSFCIVQAVGKGGFGQAIPGRFESGENSAIRQPLCQSLRAVACGLCLML